MGKRPGRLWRYRRVWFLLGLVGLTALSGLVWVIAQVPLPQVDPPIQTTVLYDATGAELATLQGAEHRLSVQLDEVPKLLQDAVVAAEDRDFYTHGGIDLSGIARALWVDLLNKGRQGGSTITQQYVKNTYVGDDPTLWRKFREAIIAVKLERSLARPRLEAKREILERYLNTVYFGRGAYGVQAASRAYFGKTMSELGLAEVAYLVGLIRSPSVGDVASDPALATQLRSNVLRAMVDSDYVTAEQAAEAEAVPLDRLVVPQAQARSTVALKGAGVEYFIEYVRRQLVVELAANDPRGPAASDEERRQRALELVRRGGLRVHTTLNPAAQRSAYTAVYGLLNSPGDPAGALVSLDRNGGVVAMVGGRDWAGSQVNLAVGASGGGTGRQGGSTFKPFLLAETIRRGYSLRSSFPGPARLVLPRADNGRDWQVSNYEDAEYGSIDLVSATVNSVNTVYAQLVAAQRPDGLKAIGPEGVVDMAHRLGIESQLAAVPSIALGTQDVSVIEMATAYNTFATEGVRIAPRVITKVELEGAELPLQPKPDTRVLAPTQARRLNGVLAEVVSRGSGVRARLPNAVVQGKTGTSDDFGDAWFVGSTDRLTTAVWMGFPDGRRPMLNIHGFSRVSGGSLPATAFQRYMSKAMTLVPAPPRSAQLAAAAVQDDSGRLVPGCCQAPPEEEGKDQAEGDEARDKGVDEQSRGSDKGRSGKESATGSPPGTSPPPTSEGP